MVGGSDLAGIKDLYTCEIVGYAMSERMTCDLTLKALNRAWQWRKPPPGLIHHSDSGSQYCARQYRQRLHSLGMRASMSGRGTCYDNAPMESFWASLKNELVHHRRFATRSQAIAQITEWIEIFYNGQRPHSRLGNLSPANFARRFHIHANTPRSKSNCPRLAVHLTIARSANAYSIRNQAAGHQSL